MLGCILVFLSVACATAAPAAASVSLAESWGGMRGGSFYYPQGSAIDSAGNLYIADTNNSRVQKFDASGTFLQQWGETDAAGNPVCSSNTGGFCYPTGISVDASGNLYIADQGNSRIAKLTVSSGTWSYFQTFNAGDSLSAPSDVAIEAATGRMFITDTGHDRIVVLSPTGVFVRAWGGSGSSVSPAQYSGPHGIKVTSTNVYVADTYNNRVLRTSLTGTSGAAVGVSGSGNGEFSYPWDVEVDSSNRLYVVDQYNHRVQRFTSGLAYSTQWGSYGSEDGQFYYPQGIALNGTTAYVTDTYNHRVQRFTTVSTTATFASKFGSRTGTVAGELSGPADVALGNAGDVYAADTGNNRIQRFTSGGTPLTSWGQYGGNLGEFYSPQGLGTDASSQVYVPNYYYYGTVDRFSAVGASGIRLLDAPLLGYSFGYPQDVAVDATGNVYVVDASGYQVDKYDPTGSTLLQTFGSYGFGNGRFQNPKKIALDADGNVYVTDASLSRVTKFAPSGALVTTWGEPGSGDGEFSGIGGVAVDASGNVYVADNNRVQKFRPDGRFILAFGAGDLSGANGVAVAANGDIFVADASASRIRRFTESDTAAPNTSISSFPPDPTNSTGATFSFDATEAGGTFECALDSTTVYSVCTSPKSYTGLTEGAHTFRVRAVDDEGNADPSPAVKSWVVDTAAPNTSITSGPSGQTYDRTPTFGFESSETGSTFECRVDADAFSPCTTPTTVSALTDGAHTFEVRAIDAASTTDPTPASRAFTVSTASASVTGSTLSVTGAGADDNLQISKPNPSTFSVTDTAITGYAAANITAGSGCTQISDTRVDCPSAGITLLDANGGAGSDRIANDAGLTSTLNGGDDEDRVIGGTAADTLIGGPGADDLLGRGGIDVADYSGRTDGLTIKIDGAASDGSATDADVSGARRDNVATDVENLIGGSGNDTLTGSTVNNVIKGGAGNDALFGDAGLDTLDGQAGADDINGGTGVDTVTYESRTTGVTVTGDGTTANDGDASDANGATRDNVRNDVETILGGTGNDSITGGPAGNTLIGGSGDDVLNGSGGNDTLDGSYGADDLIGGGNLDKVTYASRSESVNVNAGDGLANDGSVNDDNGARRDNVAGDVENLIGGSSNDLIVGNTALNLIEGGSGDDVLKGGANSDTLSGGPGADDLDGEAGTDVVTYEAATAGVTVTLAGGADDGNATDDNGARRDNVISVLGVIGSPLADTITGTTAVNTLTGGLGADTLIGLDGDDTLYARDGVVDTVLDCDGGLVAGIADALQRDASDPAGNGCETILP